jgi:hypothetical protein
MTSSQAVSKRFRILQYLLIFALVAGVLAGLAYTSGDKGPGRILIDGSQNPDQVPDWILWNQLFLTAVHLKEKSSTNGQELWIDKLHFSDKVMKEIIDHGYEQVEMFDDIRTEGEEYIADSKKAKPEKSDHPDRKEGLRINLKKSQLNLESRTLEIRDKLRKRIGDDAFLRLVSFARLQIAPTIKVGN